MITLTAVEQQSHTVTWRFCLDSFFDPLVKIERNREKKLHPPPLSKKVAYCTSLLFDGIP